MPMHVPVVDLSQFPPLLEARDLASILRLHYKTILLHCRQSDWHRIPMPAFERPYRWRRGDVERFIADANLGEQRRVRLKLRAVR